MWMLKLTIIGSLCAQKEIVQGLAEYMRPSIQMTVVMVINIYKITVFKSVI